MSRKRGVVMGMALIIQLKVERQQQNTTDGALTSKLLEETKLCKIVVQVQEPSFQVLRFAFTEVAGSDGPLGVVHRPGKSKRA
jgi:hypothetical protein